MKIFYYTPFFTCVRDYLVEKGIEVIKEGKKAIYILPSREAIFDVRKKFLAASGNLINTSVFSFSDLAGELAGKKTITEDVSLLIIRNILNNREDGFFKGVKNRPGFVTSLYGVIKRLKRLNLSSDKLDQVKYNFTGLMPEKLDFIRSVYEEYERYKEKESLYDLNDMPSVALKKIKYAPLLFQTGIIVIDGYINIDPVDKFMMKTISKYYPDIDFYCSIPFKNSYNEEFIKSEIIKDLKDLGFIYSNKTFPEKKANPSIKSLCEYLYSDETVLKGDVRGVKISNSPCIDHEVREMAGLIKKKILSGETVPEKIAIYVKNINEYSNAFEEIFNELNIPVLATWKKLLIEVPLIKDFLGLLNIYIKGREHEGIRNIFSSIYLLPSDILEKLDGKSDKIPLKRIFTGKDPSEYPDKFSHIIKEYCPDLDFSAFIDIISSLNPSGSDTKEAYLTKLIEVADRLDLKGNIINLYLQGIIEGKNFTRDIKALDSLKTIMSEIIEIEKKYNLLSEGFTVEQIYEELVEWASVERGKTAKDTGGVRILNTDLARGQYYDIVFMPGVNEGIFPSVLSENPLFDSGEHDLFMSQHINLINKKWELEREKIRFNLCMATATEELYISYRTCDEKGEYMIKSSFLDDLSSLIDEELLKALTHQKIYMRNRFEPRKEPQSHKEMLRKTIHYIWKDQSSSVDNTVCSEEILDYINHAAIMEYGRQENPFFDSYDGIVTEPSPLKNKYSFTPSRFNSYSSCPFKYFMERVLAITVDDENEPDERKIGSFYHEILKDYYKDNSCYDREKLYSIFDRVFNDTLKRLYHNIMPEKLWQFIKKEFFSVISTFIENDIKNLEYYREKTGFTMKPCFLEHPFTIKDEEKMIRGVVDRVDLEMDEQNCFTGRFIIYDYKNSSTKELKNSVEGKDFQLPLYYLAIGEQLKDKFPDVNPECIALLYYSIKEHKKSGIVRSDMKKNIFNRGGPGYTVGKENMIVLMEYISRKTSEVIEKIKNGVFTLPCLCPMENSKYPCDYRKICRYDRYRIAEKDILEKEI
ncbi:MAG TPA: PD-(D/E)XK nuclease family protein [Candidatus Eremiobacteraeota bacterium]|nr:MAG: ATP-dependent helicase/deoxyribonuclease subunit B [bacterium ADurb.Bin363]HPZ06719.1 PD-(D/E)XK nuclease family protein [Candidatus Eremiobacteraeota bacterium]